MVNKITGKIRSNPFENYVSSPEDVTEEVIERYRKDGIRIGTFYNAEINKTDVYKITDSGSIFAEELGDVLHYDIVEDYEELPKYARLKYDYLYYYNPSYFMELIYNNKLEKYLRDFSDRAITYYENTKKDLEEKYPNNNSLVKEMLNEYMKEYIKQH
ncbi:hypothetical protein [Gemelliphila palaticanis]|uniref:Uncharacterized protein n=1 Tax=Gemelliphila palaticanis TaxID=81950 RepID=A0ABX2T3F6_9BACL|nr:hypothetical protein [Gemella palaticanis]MBF0716084.1 hypothetical protein [Gemella palaticanis]NYS48014.1 hypothetical protein [Gemella palaticanis]